MKISASLLPKSNAIPKKVVRHFFYSQLLICIIVFTFSASAYAQSPDYSLPENWMCHPVLKVTDVARQQSLSLVVKNPDMSTRDSITFTQDTLVDIFYIYPTIDMDFLPGNTLMDSIDTITAQFVYREQAGLYAQFGRVFVPYYRQAKIGNFVTTDTQDSIQLQNADALELAYADVDSAFSHYLKYYNNGRKIILIGHSQGADHERFLLRRRFDTNPVLLSQLVVAISGGEPNYVSTSGSRTGGSLQYIKNCPPLDSVPECGCLMNWRTWNGDSAVHFLNKASFYYNQHFADRGLIYQIYDTVNHTHIEAGNDFGYETNRIMSRYITLDSCMNNYLAFDSLFSAEAINIPTIPGSAYLLIDSIFTPNDKRKTGAFLHLSHYLQNVIPIPPVNNYHIWDMQFVQWDLLNLIPDLIAITHPIASIPDADPIENAVFIYPNPNSGIVHINDNKQIIKSIKLYNSQGVFVQEFFTNDFSVSGQAPGMYLVVIQTEKTTYTNKLIKQ